MADTPTLTGARVLVVGASAGIGRAFAGHAIAAGADVCVAARRAGMLAELCGEAGGGHAIATDITSSEDRSRLVDEVAERLGQLDLVLHAAGAAVLSPLNNATADEWRSTLEINAIAPSILCAQLLEILGPDGLISFLTSETVSETRWGLSAYAASKSALDTAISYMRHEHPERRFQRIVLGSTMPTGFGDRFAHEFLVVALDRWVATGVSPTIMSTDDVARHLAEVMAVMLAHPGIDVPDMYLAPRGKA